MHSVLVNTVECHRCQWSRCLFFQTGSANLLCVALGLRLFIYFWVWPWPLANTTRGNTAALYSLRCCAGKSLEESPAELEPKLRKEADEVALPVRGYVHAWTGEKE